jgi:hypothetical protein
MNILSQTQLEHVGGGNSCHADAVAAGIMVGAGVGLLIGGPLAPIAMFAGAVSGGGHAFVLSLGLC